MKHGKIVASRFEPAWWLPGGDLQTLWPYYFRRRMQVDLSRKRLELPDGDFVDLCLTANAGSPIVAVFTDLKDALTPITSSRCLRPLKNRAGLGCSCTFVVAAVKITFGAQLSFRRDR